MGQIIQAIMSSLLGCHFSYDIFIWRLVCKCRPCQLYRIYSYFPHLVSLNSAVVFMAVVLGRWVALVVTDQLFQHRKPFLHIVLQRVNLRGDGSQDLEMKITIKLRDIFSTASLCELLSGNSQSNFWKLKILALTFHQISVNYVWFWHWKCWWYCYFVYRMTI